MCLPSYKQLQEEFGEDNVSIIFDGRPWQFHESCINAQPDKFYVKKFNSSFTCEEAIEWGSMNGYRPATHVELYEWHKQNKKSNDWVIALGSSTMDGGYRFVALLYGYSGRRFFGGRSFDSGWYAHDRCLFVSYKSSKPIDTNVLILQSLERIEKELAKIMKKK